MESASSVKWAVVICLIQVLWCGIGESQPCSPGFGSDLFLFKVPREHLQRGTRIGAIVFNDCSGRTHIDFMPTDKEFRVDSDGTVTLKRPVTLDNGHKTFSVHAWDSNGKKHTALVRVEDQGRANHNHEQQEDVGTSELEQTESTLLLEFPKSGGLQRRKREWVIPPIRILENDRKGPFPKPLVQIKSSHAKETQMVYRITGVGADQPPVGLFTIDKFTGQMYVSRPLDREEKDKYELQVHAHSITDSIIEPEMEVFIEVLDMNDNHPIFTQNPFLGSVPEASNIGFEFMTVSATDADDPNTDNAEIRYFITSQIPPVPYPNMFEINPVTGAIRVNSDGLDRETVGEYTLDIQAADMAGQGRGIMGKAVITVTDSNDNAPVFSKTLYEVSVPEDNVGALVAKLPVTDDDEPQSSAWAAKFRIVNGNSGGFFRISTAPNKQEGIITTVKGLDYEENNKFTLLVLVENEVPFAKPLPTSTATVIVNVLDVNEAPVFEPKKQRPWLIPPIRVSENEHGPFPKEIAQIKPSHSKTSGVKYSISGRGANLPPLGLFLMDKNTGKLSVSGPLDRETKDEYVLEAHITGLHIYESVELIIHVVDQNDNKPVFTQSPFIGRVSDAAEIGFPFMTIRATDADDSLNTNNADIRYSIISQVPPEPKPDMFAINPISGVIQVNAKGLDLSKHSEYVLKIQATDMEGNGISSTEDAVISITDSKDVTVTQSPEMLVISPIRLSENGRGPFPKQLVKLRSSQAKQTKTAYRLTGEGADQAPVGLFTVDKDSGWLSVTKPLDRETKHEYVLQAHIDGDQPTELTIRVIDQNDNKPVFTQDQFLGSVPTASKAGFKFLTISATDADDPKTQNANIRYSIISQNPALPQPNMFEINPDSGEIQVKSEGFDREKYPEYILEIQAADMQGNGLQSRVKAIITVTV
ncbi:EP-cadherin-like isoform X2 [Hemibagrus wyckioides]|uniref:EP-cadherin-like isoform X2 n=1 Tax=Hemibagrus wyckioides TaxID=337641 RepID=UPI00266B6D60|nr:EP-cadherin-like isoform X2 [Hemibagrus wyckioides]